MARIVYKLTSQDITTRGGYQWRLNEERTTDGRGELCGRGWLHFYYSPLLAVLLNPLHAQVIAPRLFKARAAGKILNDRGLKGGATSLTLVEEMPVPAISIAQRARFARLCADWAALAAKGGRLSGEAVASELHRLAEEAIASGPQPHQGASMKPDYSYLAATTDTAYAAEASADAATLASVGDADRADFFAGVCADWASRVLRRRLRRRRA